MDDRNSDKAHEMVRLTIKLADNSSENKKWNCERIDDEPESGPKSKIAHGPKESLPINNENTDEETEDSGNWYKSIPSYLEIEMKEVENRQPSCGSSTENNTNSFQTYAIPSHGAVHSSNNSYNDPWDLPGKSSKSESQEDPKSKYLESVCVDSCNTSIATEDDKIVQNETAYHIPRVMRSHHTYPIPNLRLMDSKEIMAMSRRATPSINQNFSMEIQRNFPVSSGFANSEKPVIATQNNFLDSREQKPPSTLVPNDRHFSVNTTKYGHSSNQYHSEVNRCQSWRMQGKDNNVPTGNEFTERIGDTSVNNLSQNYVSHHKRPLTNCVQIGSNDVNQPSYPPNKKKSQDRTLHYCKLCNSTFKSSNSLYKHLKSEKHLRISNQVNPQQSSFNNFQPNSAIRPFPPMNIPAQLPPIPLFHLMSNQMWYHHYLANAMSAANQLQGDGTKINNTDEQNANPGITMPGMSLGHVGSQIESYAPNMRFMIPPVNHINNPPNTNLETTKILDDIRSQNYFRMNSYAQNPRFVNLPTSHTSHSQGICLNPCDPQSENSLTTYPNYLENEVSQSGGTLKNLSPEIQSENSTATCSSQKSEDVQAVSQDQKSSFHIYHCMVCSVFHTDFFQELEKHVSDDRSGTPFEMVTTSENYSLCKLCDFQTPISNVMALHCARKSHMMRVEYYNHVMESGINKNEKLKDLENFSAVSLFCSACEFSTEMISTLRVHSADRRHQHNVSCYLHAACFNRDIEYCYCRACKVKTYTKRELLKHIRSEKHWIKLQGYPLEDSTFKDPKNLLFFKDLKENEQLGILEQPETSSFIRKEIPYLANINTDNREITENPQVDSASSTSQQPLPLPCLLCQQMFPESSVLVDHIQRIHNVNEDGMKWFLSEIIQKNLHIHEGTVSQEERLAKTDKQKSIVFSPRTSSADEKLSIKGENVASFSDRTYVATKETTTESEPSASLGVDISGKSVATDQNQAINTDSSSNQQPCETKCTWDSDKLDQNAYASPHIKPSTASSNQQLPNKECMRNSEKSDGNLDFDQVRRKNVEFLSKQQICNTGNMLPLVEEKVNPAKELNSSSSPKEIIAENELQVNVNSKLEMKADFSSESFSAIEHGSPTSQSNLNQNCKRNDSFSCDSNSVKHERLPTSDGSSTEHDSPISQSYLDSNRGKNDSFISDHKGSPISHSILNANAESYDSSSSLESYDGYKQPPEKVSSTEKNMVNLSPSQNYLLDSQERRSPLEDQHNPHLRRKIENDSPSNRSMICEYNQQCLFDSQNKKWALEDQMNLNLDRKVDADSHTSSFGALVESKLKAKSSNLITRGNPVKCEMESRDSRAAVNAQMQAEKHIENLEISDVFSLTDCVDYIYDSDEDEDEDELDYEDVFISDLEEL